MVAARLLEKLGCRVDVAANGREAVEMVGLLPYDAIFMDCQMPEMDGFEATQEIRKREGLSVHRPIIAMTANAMQGDRERCLDAGMDDYVSKPIRKADLTEALERHLPKNVKPIEAGRN
jgi:CheY-like chemotaxis protein